MRIALPSSSEVKKAALVTNLTVVGVKPLALRQRYKNVLAFL